MCCSKYQLLRGTQNKESRTVPLWTDAQIPHTVRAVDNLLQISDSSQRNKKIEEIHHSWVSWPSIIPHPIFTQTHVSNHSHHIPGAVFQQYTNSSPSVGTDSMTTNVCVCVRVCMHWMGSVVFVRFEYLCYVSAIEGLGCKMDHKLGQFSSKTRNVKNVSSHIALPHCVQLGTVSLNSI